MIRIKRLYAHDFKQLRQNDLKFPESGRILVQGRNEAGKSTLFEAIFFGLFGKALATEGGSGRGLDDLIGYDKNKARVELDIAVQPDLPLVTADRVRLQQILLNLLSNAVKFTPKNGRVRVSVQSIDSRVEIAVADTGLGIDAVFLPHVFNRFSQRDSSSTRSVRGLGLGLAIARQTVLAHDGSVSATSTPGKGTEIRFVLPRGESGNGGLNGRG